MNRLQKYGKYLLLLLALAIAGQVGASYIVKSRRIRGYLIAHLEKSFGRPVEAGQFSVQLLPVPGLDVDGVTIGEDPSFGHEYFLRAEHMSARLHWMGLLRGHFDFGTMSLTRPSLILTRNEKGRWNLEDWLPPTRVASTAGASSGGQQRSAQTVNNLRKIEFDDGRINFKTGDDKRPFAFTKVSGSVEQTGPGRWQLRLEAQPWRSGVALQSTGTIQVSGDVAGTSLRLQPAQIRLHWDRVSLADLFRLITGNDPGVRGELALDGDASIGGDSSGEGGGPGEWKFNLQARARRIHRWDLTERSDNPSVNVNVNGNWNVAAGEVRAEQVNLEMPHSALSGSLLAQTTAPLDWEFQAEHVSVAGHDLVAWYRAFQPGMVAGLSLEEFFSGEFQVRGWPIEWESMRVASDGGRMVIPEFDQPVRIEPFAGKVAANRLVVEPVRILLGERKAKPAASANPEKAQNRPRAGAAVENAIEASLREDFSTKEGTLRANLRLADVTRLFQFASAFGQTLNRGWELTGEANAKLEVTWQHGWGNRRWSGSSELKNAELQAAGLNQPIKLDDASVEWKEGKRGAVIRRVEAFGAAWSGTIEEAAAANSGEQGGWQFRLHADRLDATDLDRWVGPRARPNWLQRVLPSLLGNSNTEVRPSELLRRVSAEGELTADELTIEKVKLAQAKAGISLRNLHLEVKDAEGQWAGGTIRGSVTAEFSPVPTYEVSAELDRVNLGQLPWPVKWAERWSGLASGRIQLTTGGVGRDELLKQLAGRGDVKLKNVEFRGWDVAESVQSGSVQTGVSRWTSGTGVFLVKDRAVDFEVLQLEAPHARTRLAGTFGFGQDARLTFALMPASKRGKESVSSARVLQVSGLLESPQVAVESAAPGTAKP